MSEYTLRYSPQYMNDFTEKMDYIAYELCNPDAAVKLYYDAKEAIQNRLDCAESFEPVPSRKKRDQPYFRIYVHNFEIYYVIVEESGKKYMELRRFLYQGENKKTKL